MAFSKHRHPRRRGIYLLPNLFTTVGMFAGFYSIVAAMNGAFEAAAMAIFVAMVMDSLDGRVARLTNTQSDFGVEYDSLADMVSFGVAPALVIYSWQFSHLGKLGWLAAFLFTATVALRLARFNTQASSSDKRYFQGLPSPAGAGVLASMVWLGYNYSPLPLLLGILVALVTIFVALLMVSNIRYHSMKQVDLKGKVSFFAILVMVLIFIAISIDPPKVFFLCFMGYALSGPIFTLWQLRKKRLARALGPRQHWRKRVRKNKP